ncbi:DUF2922 domain-containing protein [Clostridium sp.]|uniref:DUF2922 domain-containing protein n=1 Tax=Clostridium sp. TaxID=1506 RepID=UPI002FC988C6
MVKDLVMTFSDIVGEKSNLILKNVKEVITQEEVTGLMDTIIASQLFYGKNSVLQKKEYATLVETTKTKYEDL